MTARLRERVSAGVYGSPLGFRLLQLRRRMAAPLELVRRRRAVRTLAGPSDTIAIDPELGYRRFAPGELPGANRVLAILRGILAEMRPHLAEMNAAHPVRARIVFDLLCDERLDAMPELVDFALSEPLLEAVVDYLGTVPVLRRVALGYSPGDEHGPGVVGSRLYHLDGEDDRQLKLFLNLAPTGRENGPFTFLPAARSAEIVRRLPRLRPESIHARYRAGPIPDDAVHELVDTDELLRLEGPPGCALLVDTSRCLHFGSRVAPGAERAVLMLAYQRYHAVHETPHNVIDRARYAADQVRSFMLRPPHERPTGFFFPDPLVAPGPAYRGGALGSDPGSKHSSSRKQTGSRSARREP